MNFATRLKELREENNLLQKELADKIGVKRGTVASWESGRNPERNAIEKLANLFNCSVDYLLGRSDTRETPEQLIESAILDEPELIVFFHDLEQRDDLQLLFKQVRPLPPEAIKRIIKYIKMVEDEESMED